MVGHKSWQGMETGDKSFELVGFDKHVSRGGFTGFERRVISPSYTYIPSVANLFNLHRMNDRAFDHVQLFRRYENNSMKWRDERIETVMIVKFGMAEVEPMVERKSIVSCYTAHVSTSPGNAIHCPC
jgi:hypothetical protein